MKPVVAAVVALAVFAFGAVGCGGDDSKEASGAASSDAAPGPEAGGKAAKGAKKNAKAGKKAGGKAGAGAGLPPALAKLPKEPGPYEPAASGDRYDPSASDGKVHGDGSIEKFGEAPSDDEAKAAVAAAVGFYEARAQDDWARACGLMAVGTQKQLSQTFGEQLKGAGCPAILAALAGGVPKELRVKEAKQLKFTGFRAEGERGFALFVSDTIPYGFVPMALEDDEWRVAALSGSSL